MFNILLILHLLAVCCWVGGALYERFFIVGSIRRTKGTVLEATFIKLVLSTAPFFLTSVFIILVTGIIMTAVYGYGFFEFTWIGLKQYILLAIMLVFALLVGPRMGRIGKQLKNDLDSGKPIDDSIRAMTGSVVILLDIIHLGVLANVILAVTKYF